MGKNNEDTPLLKQYFAIKAQHPEAILLYRVGDFYETYSDDALLASKVLGIVLTKRSNGDKEATPMAGFPHHAIETYLQKLVRSGYKVAICDQLEDPKLAQSKLVKRGITEILTPGVAFGESMLDQKEHNYLAGLTFDNDSCGAAFLDVSTGTFQVAQGSVDYISSLLSSLHPKELVVQREICRRVKEKFPDFYVSSLDEWAFVFDAAYEKLRQQLGVPSLKGFAIDNYPLSICSAGALIVYLEQTQHTGLKNICSISRIDENKFVWMDRFTFRNLEIFSSASGRDGVALVDVIDRCSSPMGARLLREWLAMPIMDIQELNERYDVVEWLHDNEEILGSLTSLIGNVGDLERIISRAATGKIFPREVRQLGRSLAQMAPIGDICRNSDCRAINKIARGMRDCEKILSRINSILDDQSASMLGKGDVVCPGVNAELDELRSISRGGKEYLMEMQRREIERTGISSLKISYNNVFGYYIEVRNTFRDKVPAEWIRKQTLVSAERYITEELKEYESRIMNAEARIYEIESGIFAELVSDIQSCIKDIQYNCSIVSKLDVLAGFAVQALEKNYCRPVVDKSLTLDIKGGRHPVIETLMAPGEEYVTNDLILDSVKEQIMILTGPNMSGKSALLRQSALIVLMAQIGSFVPAESVQMGFFDKIFTRVGATDNISRGESTFMVEMLETAMIMHNLSSRSLVLLDEIGRGTSTYDGMSIARALVEYTHEHGKGAKTLFATHYHELNDLENLFPRVKNYHISVKEDGKNVIFLRKLCPGGVAHSFGIHVARMAGMPKEVIDSAERTLRELERKEKSVENVAKQGKVEEDGSVQLSFFQLDDPTLSSIKEQLEGADLNNMTPLQAFDLLRSMKKELGI
ncbi:MAG: DNA mismatch repair protein MutS [Bacteroidales bacterium]|nr:DNA mismatch repair protein MutS [Bacteroidales bacterium]